MPLLANSVEMSLPIYPATLQREETLRTINFSFAVIKSFRSALENIRKKGKYKHEAPKQKGAKDNDRQHSASVRQTGKRKRIGAVKFAMAARKKRRRKFGKCVGKLHGRV